MCLHHFHSWLVYGVEADGCFLWPLLPSHISRCVTIDCLPATYIAAASPAFAMDQILKARQLGSATARRKRMQERETAMLQDEERRMRILLYGYSSAEDESSDDEGNSYSPIPDALSDRPRPTSRPSVVRHYSSIPSFKSPTEQPPSPLPLASTQPSKPSVPELVIPQPFLPTVDQYHAKSMVPEGEADEPPLIAEPESPVEIATPILYSIPRARPSVISIKTSISPINTQALHRPVSMPHPPPIPARSPRRISTMSVKSAGSPAGHPITSLPSLPGQVSEHFSMEESHSVRRRPLTISVQSEPVLQHQRPSYDVFPRRSKMTSYGKIDQHIISEERPQATAASASQDTLSARRTSPSPTAPKETESTAAFTLQSGLHTKKSSPTLRQRRSSIGLALRNASSSLRGKKTSGRPTTSSSSGSVESTREVDIGAFPLPPPPPLPQHSFGREMKSKGSSSGSSRLRGTRMMVGF